MYNGGRLEFEWDAANISHLKRHRVPSIEFEQAMMPAIHVEYEVVDDEGRYHSIGPTSKGRLLYMVWTFRNGRIRAVTAFDAPAAAKREWKERQP